MPDSFGFSIVQSQPSASMFSRINSGLRVENVITTSRHPGGYSFNSRDPGIADKIGVWRGIPAAETAIRFIWNRTSAEFSWRPFTGGSFANRPMTNMYCQDAGGRKFPTGC